MGLFRVTAAALMGVVLCACAAQGPSATVSAASRPLLAPATLGTERAVNQVVRGAFGEREMTMNCVVTVKDGIMTIVGLSAMGVRIFTVTYDGASTTIDNSLPIPAQLTPERLLADLQLVFWPLNSLAKPLQTGGWKITESTPATRRLRHGERLIAEVHYASADPWTGRSWLVNLEHGYTLSIDSKAM